MSLTQNPIKAIHTDEEHAECLREIDSLLDDPGAEAQQRLEVLSILVDAYENDHHELPPPDPIEALKFIMDQRGLRPADLEPLIGSRARVSEVLSRKRNLTLPMIRRLSRALKVPADLLIGGTDKG